MKTSIATVSISGDFAEKLAAIAAAGFDGIEIFENDFLIFDGTPKEVRQTDHPIVKRFVLGEADETELATLRLRSSFAR